MTTAATAEAAMLREALEDAVMRHPSLEDFPLIRQALAADPADWLAEHDEKVRAEADGWDAMLAQTAAIRPIIDAEIERRDRIAAGDEAAGTMPPAEWDALASLPAVPNLPGRYLDLASPDAERRLNRLISAAGGEIGLDEALDILREQPAGEGQP